MTWRKGLQAECASLDGTRQMWKTEKSIAAAERDMAVAARKKKEHNGWKAQHGGF